MSMDYLYAGLCLSESDSKQLRSGSISAPGVVSSVPLKGFRDGTQLPMAALLLNNYDLKQINYPVFHFPHL